MEIVSLLTTTLHPLPWTTPPILAHTHTHAHTFCTPSTSRTTKRCDSYPIFFAFLVSLALMLWSRTHCVFPALYVRVFSPTMSVLFSFFFFFFSLPPPSVKKIAFYQSGWSPKSLIPKPKGHNKPDRCRIICLRLFFWGGEEVTSKDDNKTRQEKRAMVGEEWRGRSSQAVMLM